MTRISLRLHSNEWRRKLILDGTNKHSRSGRRSRGSHLIRVVFYQLNYTTCLDVNIQADGVTCGILIYFKFLDYLQQLFFIFCVTARRAPLDQHQCPFPGRIQHVSFLPCTMRQFMACFIRLQQGWADRVLKHHCPSLGWVQQVFDFFRVSRHVRPRPSLHVVIHYS